ncbi:MAG TPA: monovalent cation/H+ antiporter subunit D family protein [Firmicutes bacterium]|nr:monovalent cation/H+ antiporter subunit D family protein [Bacillota bacterium]
MNPIAITLILGVVFFPFVMTFALYFAEHFSEKTRNTISVITAAVTFLASAALYPFIKDGQAIEFTLFEIFANLEISFRLDLLGYALLLVASFVWMLVTFYTLDYMSGEHACNRYYPVHIVTLGSCLGIFMAGDLFTLFVFFEMMSLMAYVLVVHEETPEALKAGYKYLIFTIVGGLALFFGIIAVFEITGTVSFSNTGLITVESPLATFAFVSFLIGFGMKAGMFPLHVWLPDAHPVAPSPASALLSGIMLKTGAYGLIRVMFHIYSLDLLRVTGMTFLLAALAIMTIFFGSAVAITQEDLKRRLAYSSIGQMGYILLGLSILNEEALIGTIFHIFSHAVMKSTLFLAAGAIIKQTGKRKVTELAGIGREMPYTMMAFAFASLAMIGLPPFNGFLSKWSLSLGALDAGKTSYVIVLLLSSLMNSVYYLPILIAAFFGGDEGVIHPVREGPVKMVVTIVALAACTVIFGLSPLNFTYRVSKAAALFLLKNTCKMIGLALR